MIRNKLWNRRNRENQKINWDSVVFVQNKSWRIQNAQGANLVHSEHRNNLNFSTQFECSWMGVLIKHLGEN